MITSDNPGYRSLTLPSIADDLADAGAKLTALLGGEVEWTEQHKCLSMTEDYLRDSATWVMSKPISVTSGTVIHLNVAGALAVAAKVDGSVYTPLLKGTANILTNYTLTVDEDCTLVFFNRDNNGTYIGNATIKGQMASIQESTSEIDAISDAVFSVETLPFEYISDCLFTTAGARDGNSNRNYAKVMKGNLTKALVSSEQVSVTANNTSYWVVIFVGEGESRLDGLTIVQLGVSNSRAFEDIEISIPSWCEYFLVNGTNASAKGNVGLPANNKIVISSIEERVSTLEGIAGGFISLKDHLDSIYRIGRIGPGFSFVEFDKAYFSWTNDDSRDDMVDYKELCVEFGVPYCPAVLYENLESGKSIGGKSLVEICGEIVANGGEILNHGTPVLTSASTYDDYVEYFVRSQEVFNNYLGFKPRGIVMHGGPDSHTLDVVLAQKFFMGFFDFANGGELSAADTSKFSPQYRLKRWTRSIGSGTEDEQYEYWKAKIDEAVANKEWVRLWTHGTDSVPISVLRRVFTYISSLKEQGLADFATWSYMYDNFGQFTY